ncbi:MAG: hypothetical protein AB7O37_24125 [Vicinamibacteria bacterium]|jgi:transposase-like protein
MAATASTEEFRRQLLAEHQSSGLSVRAFAEERGIPAGTFASWGHRLRRKEAEAQSGSEPSFVPVRVVEAVPQLVERTRGGYEVELGVGRVIRLPADFDEARAAALIQAVASC